MQYMDSPLQPSDDPSVAASKFMECLCMFLDNGTDLIHRAAALQPDDKVIVEQVGSCLFLVFPESGLEE